MAGMGDALGFMVAGAAGNYADNRSTDIRAEEKAKIAEDREKRLASYNAGLQSERDAKQQEYTVTNQSTQNQFTSGESAKDRESREKLAAAQNSTQLAAANISAGSRAGRRETDHDIVGQPQKEMDEDGQPTGRYLVARRNGEMEVVDPADLPMRGGGANISRKQQQENKSAEDKYVKSRISETAGLLSSDAEDFKQWGGSRAKAEAAFRDEFRQQNGIGGDSKTPATTEPDQPAAAAKAPVLSANANAVLDAARKANPGVSDEALINALKGDATYGKYFK